MVKKKVENTGEGENGEVSGGLEEIESDAKGNGYLPGQAPVVVKALVEQVKNIEIYLKPAFASARDALVAGKDELSRLAHENIQHFSPPDEKGTRVYKGGGIKVEITFEKEKISGSLVDDED